MANKKSFHIVEKFKIFICISLAVALLGGVFMLINVVRQKNAMNFGIDFTGGAIIDIYLGDFARDKENRDIVDETVSDIIENEFGCKKASEMTYSVSSAGEGSYVICEYRLTPYRDGKVITDEKESYEFVEFVQNTLCVEITEKLTEKFESDPTLKAVAATFDDSEDNDPVTAHSVSASSAGSLLTKAIIALLVAIALMLVYIIIRFTASSALAAVCALIHDVVIMVALTTMFDIPVNATFVAAVITIVGYSINATIIIFDRIREELKSTDAKDKTDVEIANLAIKDTLNRTILTTVTTLVMVVILAFFSVSTISEFIVPIIFGLLAGAYSSVLLAPSIWVAFRKVAKKAKEKREAKKGYQGK